MSLSTAFNVISSSFAANAAQTSIVSNNIANVNTPGYSREIANVVTNSYGGADVASVAREANAALLEQVSSSTSQAATQQAISSGLATLAQTVDDSSSTSSASGAGQNGASPSAMLANLESALTTYADSPTSSSPAARNTTSRTKRARSGCTKISSPMSCFIWRRKSEGSARTATTPVDTSSPTCRWACT